MSDPILCLKHGDAWYYFLPGNSWNRPTWRAEAEERTEDLTPVRDRWHAGTFLADRIARIAPTPAKTVAWQLIDQGAVSDRFPLHLTPEEFAAREAGKDEDSESVERSLYRAITEPQPDQIEYLTGPWLRADGEPAPADGRTWVARLPYELSNHRELLHLFPGALQGFREALAERLKRIPDVEVYTSSGFQVYAKVPYDPPRQSWQGELLRSGERSKRRGREVAERLTRSQHFNPPREIAGVNRAAAVAAWDEAMAKFVAVVTEMATVRPCGTCGGSGISPHEKRVVTGGAS